MKYSIILEIADKQVVNGKEVQPQYATAEIKDLTTNFTVSIKATNLDKMDESINSAMNIVKGFLESLKLGS